MDFSIIIPTFNRNVQLRACLQALAELNYPKESFEVIVVDDGGFESVSVQTVAEVFLKQIPLRVLIQVNQGAAAARNRGAAHAQGKVLVFTDDDCRPHADWLSKINATMCVHKNSVVIGKTLNALEDNSYSKASQMLVDYLMGYYDSKKTTPLTISSNLAVPAEAFKSIGGFDERFRGAGGEDRDFGYRWFEDGRGVVHASDVKVDHFHRLTFWGFLSQHFYYGRGAFLFRHSLSQRSKKPVKVEPLSFYCSLVAFPFRFKAIRNKTFISILLIFSQIANAGGFFAEGLRHCLKRK